MYDPARRIDFSGQAPSGLTWISETQYVWPKSMKEGGVEWLKVTAATGVAEPLFDAQKFAPGENAGWVRDGGDAGEARRLRPIPQNIRSCRSPTVVPVRPRSPTSGMARRQCGSNCWRNEASRSGSATTGSPAARALNPNGRVTRTSASSNFAVSRMVSPTSGNNRGSRLEPLRQHLHGTFHAPAAKQP